MSGAFGGVLHPEIRELAGRMNHGMPGLENGDIHPDPNVIFADRHEVSLVPDGAFARILGCETIRVNSLHGQGLHEPASRTAAQGISNARTPAALQHASAPLSPPAHTPHPI